MTAAVLPEGRPAMRVATHPDVRACVDAPGAEHDYRIVVYRPYPKAPEQSSFVCVWCSAVACGNPGDADACIEPYHHEVLHRTRAGVTWPIGGNRPAG